MSTQNFLYGELVKSVPEFSPNTPQPKHAYSNIENFTTKNWKFSDKNSDIFHISAQNIDCGYPLEPSQRGGSNGYLNLCFWAEIRKCKPL